MWRVGAHGGDEDMNSTTMRLVLPLALIAALGGCNLIKKGGGTPKGQVVATVNGQEITETELQGELGGAPMPTDPNVAKIVQQNALQRIVARDLLAQAAHDQKLDQSPEFAMQMARAKRDLQVQLLERKLASEVPPPNRDEAERFVSDNPGMFAQRQMLVVEQVQAPRANDPTMLKALEPLNDLGQVEAMLDTKRLPHQRTMVMVDTLRMEPRMVEQINKMKPGELLIIASPQGLLINQIKESHTVPFTGDAAVQFAQRTLAQQRSQEAVSKQGQALIKAGQDKVKYNASFKPSPGPAPRTPAPAATAAAGPPAAGPNASFGSSPGSTTLNGAGSQAGSQPYALGK
jgi:EpsD family peptidyl-prolyl cis-trans isomerase